MKITRVFAFTSVSTVLFMTTLLAIRSGATQKTPPFQTATATEFRFRSFDGSGNNKDNPTWGQINTQLLRFLPPAYDDGFSAPRARDANGKPLPNPRDISNAVINQYGKSIPNSRNASAWIWVWGQFIDHDLTLTEPHLPTSPLSPIPVLNPNDPLYPLIFFARSDPFPGTGTGSGNPRQQFNDINSYIDASQIYGTDADMAKFLRTNDGTGKLRSQITSRGEFLPFNDPVNPRRNANPFQLPPGSLFIAGDPRSNENIALSALHTLFLREHNRLAKQFGATPDTDARAAALGLSRDEYIYQTARAVVAAEIQAITYNEYLPLLLGKHALGKYEGYKPNVNATVSSEFAEAAFRIGHTQVAPEFIRLNNDGTSATTISLLKGTSNPQLLLNDGIDSILLGLASQKEQEVDSMVVEDLRTVSLPGGVGFDLPAIDIERGRDHGLPSYNNVRAAFGLVRYKSFNQITSDQKTVQRLRNAYGLNPDGSDNVDAVDLVVGGMCEKHVKGGMVGELFSRIIADQFRRSRDGDRFFYLNPNNPNPDIVALQPKLETLRLSDIIREHSTITNIQDDAFVTQKHP